MVPRCLKTNTFAVLSNLEAGEVKDFLDYNGYENCVGQSKVKKY